MTGAVKGEEAIGVQEFGLWLPPRPGSHLALVALNDGNQRGHPRFLTPMFPWKMGGWMDGLPCDVAPHSVCGVSDTRVYSRGYNLHGTGR